MVYAFLVYAFRTIDTDGTFWVPPAFIMSNFLKQRHINDNIAYIPIINISMGISDIILGIVFIVYWRNIRLIYIAAPNFDTKSPKPA